MSGQLVEMKMLKMDMDNNTEASKESWEGLWGEDKGVDKVKGENIGADLVSVTFS